MLMVFSEKNYLYIDIYKKKKLKKKKNRISPRNILSIA